MQITCLMRIFLRDELKKRDIHSTEDEKISSVLGNAINLFLMPIIRVALKHIFALLRMLQKTALVYT